MNKRIASMLALVLVCMVSVAAAEIPQQGQPFVVASATELGGMFFTSLWGNNTSDIDVRAMIHNYSPVVWSDQTSMEINTLVVEDVSIGEYDNGNRAYVFTIHDDLIYCDGSPITAADYVFSLMLQAGPYMAELGASVGSGSHITGYDAYHSGQSEAFAGVRLEDERTFIIQVDAENYPFFYELSYLDVMPYPMAVIAPGCKIVDTNEGATIQNIDPEIETPLYGVELLTKTILDPETGYLSHPSVTAGAYRLTSFDWDTREASFEINPHFKGTYDGVQPHISPIVYKHYPAHELIAAYEAGEAHLINRLVSGEDITQGLALVSSGAALSLNYPRMGLGYLNFACEREVFSHETVRKAVAYAFDKETFCREFTPYSVMVYGYMGVGQWLYAAVTAEDGASFAESDEDRQAWMQLTLDKLNHYDQDIELAEQLLIDDGWTLNAQGQPYEKGTDTIRHKEIDGALVGLIIHWGKTANSSASDMVAEMLPGPLAEIGIELVIEEVPFREVLADFYRVQDRRFDMHMLASNMSNLFDPSKEYGDPADDGGNNTTGLADARLEAIALAMRGTQPGALLEYAAQWVQFQEYWNDRLPLLPLYSNIYFDVFIPELANYRPDAEQNWPEAIVRARIEEITEEEPEAEEASGDDGIVMFKFD